MRTDKGDGGSESNGDRWHFSAADKAFYGESVPPELAGSDSFLAGLQPNSSVQVRDRHSKLTGRASL